MNAHDPVSLQRGALPGELLSPERSAELAQPMRWLDTTAQYRIVDAFRGWFARWCADWSVTIPDDSPELVSWMPLAGHATVVEHDAPVWRMLDESRCADVWWTLQSDGEPHDETLTPEQVLQHAWFGSHDGDRDSMAAALAHAAWADWRKRSFEWLGATPPDVRSIPSSFAARPPCALPAAMSHSWSGAACLRIAWSGRTLSVAVDGAAIGAWLVRVGAVQAARAAHGAPAEVVPLATAIRDVRVDLRVELSSVEIDLGDLMSLAKGDIIRTRHALDEPLYVSTIASDSAAPEMFCRAYLGSRDASLAIAMVNPSSVSAEGREFPLAIR